VLLAQQHYANELNQKIEAARRDTPAGRARA